MEEQAEFLFVEFCNNMHSMSHYGYAKLWKRIEVDLQYYGDDEKIDYIQSKRNEIRDKLVKSDYNYSFPLERVKSDLVGGLKRIFNDHLFTEFTEVQYDELLKKSEYKFDMTTGILTINSKPYEHSPYRTVDFSQLDEFKPIVQHLVWLKVFIKLNNLYEELKEGKKVGEDKILSENNASEEYSEQLKNINVMAFHKKSKKIIKTPLLEELPNKLNELPPLYLCQVFVSTSKYNQIMGILVEQKKCHPDNHLWIGTEKGDYSYLAAILKYLFNQGYYKNNRLSHKQIKEIIKNTFGLDIGIDCIKRAKPDNFDLKIIPHASTLDL